VIGVLAAALVAAASAYVASRLTEDDPTALPAIAVGTCLSSDELARGRSDLHDLDAVPCSSAHDAEVFSLRTANAGEDLDAIAERCLTAATDLGVSVDDLGARELELRPLALTSSALTAGDTVACFVRHQRGRPLRGAVITTPGSDR
jgi:hypothetical protein